MGLALAKRSLSPMEQSEATQLLARMKATTRSRSELDDDIVFQVNVYAEKCTKWPADVVRKVLTEWDETHDFWPTWAQLVEVMEPKVRKRRALVEVLEKVSEQN